MSDDPKAAPSLADRYFAEIVTPHGDISDFDGEVLAALRAVEAVRALHKQIYDDTDCEICLQAYPCDTAKAVGIESTQTSSADTLAERSN